MSRPSLVLVVLVLALSAVTVAGAVTQEDASAAMPVVGTTPGEPNHLAINDSEVRRSNTTAMDLDVGSAISADSDSLQASYVQSRFEIAYENAPNQTARSRVLAEFSDHLGQRTAALESRDRENILAYASGAIGSEQFFRERARIHHRASELQQALSDMSDPLPRRPGNGHAINGRLEVLQGPTSSMAVDTLSRVGGGQATYLEVSDSGYTLASISNGVYFRETFLGSERAPNSTDKFDENTTDRVGAAETRARALYPWVSENRFGGSTWGFGRSGIYRFRTEFPGGALTTYLDGGTTNVFREAQERTVTSFNMTESVNRTEDSVRLTVNRTFETGPAEIRLYDTATNTPINGTVELGNRDPVWLGDDGRLWVVEPREDVQLNATAGTTRFSTSLSGF